MPITQLKGAAIPFFSQNFVFWIKTNMIYPVIHRNGVIVDKMYKSEHPIYKSNL